VEKGKKGAAKKQPSIRLKTLMIMVHPSETEDAEGLFEFQGRETAKQS